jgi:hypothetical protein
MRKAAIVTFGLIGLSGLTLIGADLYLALKHHHDRALGEASAYVCGYIAAQNHETAYLDGLMKLPSAAPPATSELCMKFKKAAERYGFDFR